MFRLVACAGLLGLAVGLVSACGAAGSEPPQAGDETIVAFSEAWYANADPVICDRLTDDLLEISWGQPGEPGRAECRVAVAEAEPRDDVSVSAPAIDEDTATVDVSYRLDGESYVDRLEFRLVGGVWFAEGVSLLTPAPDGSQEVEVEEVVDEATVTEADPQEAEPMPEAAPPVTPGAPPDLFAPLVFPLTNPGGSEPIGRVILNAEDPEYEPTVVVVTLDAAELSGNAVQLTSGRCGRAGGTSVALKDLVFGTSLTTIPTTVVALQGAPHKIVVRRGSDPRGAVLACGQIPAESA